MAKTTSSISETMRNKIESEPDFVSIKRFDFSLKKILERYPQGAPDKIIAQALGITEEEVDQIYQKLILKLRKVLTDE